MPVICEEEKESFSNILKRKIASSILHIPAERTSTEKNFHALGVEKGISFSGAEVLQQYYLKGKYVVCGHSQTFLNNWICDAAHVVFL